MSELRGLGAINDQLKSQGVSMMAVSVDSPEESLRVVERNKLAFPILSDRDGRVVREYGVLHAGGGPKGSDVAIPAQFLIDQQGKIVWRRIASKIQDRPDPQDLLQIVRERLGSRRSILGLRPDH